MIIKLSEDKNIKLIDYPYNAKAEELEKKSESEPKFEEGIAERTKMRRQNTNEENRKG